MALLISLRKLFIFALIIVFVTNCKSQKKNRQWDEASFDPQISRNTIYAQLDREKEVSSALESNDIYIKRTSGVRYFSSDTEKLNFKDEYLKRLNNCRANYFHSDTLSIRIGISTGFSAWGFVIFYKNKEFFTEPFYSVDIAGFEKSTYKIVHQKLTLDKETFNVGDSLFGKIDFKSVETTPAKREIEHFGSGYFRAKVENL